MVVQELLQASGILRVLYEDPLMHVTAQFI